MATSGLTTLEFDALEIIEEAYERCGLEARNGYDIRTARRSLNILAQEWANRGLNLWTIEEATLSLVAGTQSYNLPTDTIDVLEFKLREGSGTDQTDREITRVSVSRWADIYNKNHTGKPTQVYVERKLTPVVKVWPVPEEAATMAYWRLRRIEDVTSAAQTFDAPMRFVPALVAGLAFHLSVKRAPERSQALNSYYEDQYRIAADEDRDRSDWMLSPRMSRI